MNISTLTTQYPQINVSSAPYSSIIPHNNQKITDFFERNKKTLNNSKQYNYSTNNIYNPKYLLKAFTNKKYIDEIVKTNPNIKKLLNSEGIKYQVNINNINNITNTHLLTTKAYALSIANAMKLSPLDKKILEEASILHDFGKILIPEEIINKPGKLTEKERNIINLHSELGYELLSQSGINQRTLNIIRNHHTANKSDDILSHILSVADIYSALREERSYKKPLSEEESLKILDQKAHNGEVSTEVVNVLKGIITESKAA